MINEKKGLSSNCKKKTECIVVSKKNGARCELQMKTLPKFKYLGNILKE